MKTNLFVAIAACGLLLAGTPSAQEKKIKHRRNRGTGRARFTLAGSQSGIAGQGRQGKNSGGRVSHQKRQARGLRGSGRYERQEI